MSSFDLVAVVVVVIVFVVLGFVFEFDTLYGEYLVGVRFSFSAVVDYLFPLLRIGKRVFLDLVDVGVLLRIVYEVYSEFLDKFARVLVVDRYVE